MPASVNEWDNEYARLARIASQLRSGSTRTAVTPNDLHHHLTRLESQVNVLGLSPAESQRRRRLVQHLQGNSVPYGGGVGGGGTSSYSTPLPQQQQHQQTPPSSMHMALKQQDDLLDELAIGVGRLRDQTQLIEDEARMHVNLLGDVEQNLGIAHEGLEAETKRAARLKEDQSVWRLQLTVAGLAVLMVLLILAGLS
jgi:hypothetical protein